nr:hypothetical protein [Tanacetum cinerariifolium]
MSDSEDSTVTHTEVSSPFESLSDIGYPRVKGPPIMLEDPYAYVVAAFQAPPSPDYVSGPEDPEQVPPLPEFVPELVYPEFMPLKDEILPAEKQPLPAADSPAVDSPRYILESDPEEDLADYPIGKDEDDDDDEEESSEDEEEDEDEEEEEEHPALDDSISPPPVHHTTARIYIPVQAPTPVWSEAEIGRLLAIPSPLSLCLSIRIPSCDDQAESRGTIYFPFTTIEYTTIRYATTSIDTFTYIITTFALPSTSRREDVPEVTLPPRKRLRIALGPRFEVGESSSAPIARPTGGFRADYGFVATLNDEISRDPERETITDEIYGRLDDAQDDRVLMSGQLNMLRRDRRDHARTSRLMETEIRISRQAWVQSMDASDTARAEVMLLRTTVLAHQRLHDYGQ